MHTRAGEERPVRSVGDARGCTDLNGTIDFSSTNHGLTVPGYKLVLTWDINTIRALQTLILQFPLIFRSKFRCVDSEWFEITVSLFAHF